MFYSVLSFPLLWKFVDRDDALLLSRHHAERSDMPKGTLWALQVSRFS